MMPLSYLENKVKNNMLLNENDILKLTFLPLMHANENRSLRAIKSIELAEKIENNEDKTKCISMLYALFEKFGDEISKKKFKEVFSMTEIGKMIRDEGIKEGLEKGIEKGKTLGKAETLIKLLSKKLGKIPEEYKIKIKALSEDTIDIISLEIFDIKNIEEIEKYL